MNENFRVGVCDATGDKRHTTEAEKNDLMMREGNEK